MELAYRILNVFTVPGDRLSGNALCVFEDGRGVAPERMQALARQLNLSETTFVLPPSHPGATARVRIFTPDFEMPFAGHPTLGTAHVVRATQRTGDSVALEMPAGLVPVRARGDHWTLTAARAPVTRTAAAPDELEAMLGLPAGSVVGALWVDTGSEQLVVEVREPGFVRAARPDSRLLERHGRARAGAETLAYVFAAAGGDDVEARFFFEAGGGVVEDPATGSACANLGGWLLARGAPLPAHRVVSQGAAVRRPSRLVLDVDAERHVHVGGEVVELGRGTMRI